MRSRCRRSRSIVGGAPVDRDDDDRRRLTPSWARVAGAARPARGRHGRAG
jgi:hypothetical protein